MKTSEETAEIFAALAKVGGQLKNPTKTATAKAGSYSYGYAPLDKIAEDARASLGDQGMACLQELLTDDDGRVGIVTRLTHSSGQWLEMGPFWLPGGETAQQHGSAATYARRYTLSAALLLAAEEDDDASTVSKQRRTTRKAREEWPPAVAAPTTSGEDVRVPAPSSSSDSTSGADRGLDGAGSEEAGGAEAGEGVRGDNPEAPLSSVPPVEDEHALAMRTLMGLADGNVQRAATFVNKANKTAYTKTTLEQASAEELWAGAEQGEANG